VPNLMNRTGGDMYLFPGFILYRASKQAFALIDFRDVMLRFVSTRFTERDAIPADSQTIGYTWAKCNKDGTPDRRFRENYQIPLVHYGELLFSTNDGLDVRYICSNPKSAEDFVKAWGSFQMSFLRSSPDHAKGPVPPALSDYANDLEKAHIASLRLQAASAAFQRISGQFTTKLSDIAKQPDNESASQLNISVEDFEAYTSSVNELINAAKDCEMTATVLSNTLRAKYRAAIKKLETHHTAFSTVSNGETSGEAFIAFLNAAADYLNAQSEFLEAFVSAIQKKNRRLGVH